MPKGKLPAQSSDAQIAAFLGEAASESGLPQEAGGRLVFALDATASREPTWDLARSIQGQMFDAAAQLGGVRIQLCHYGGVGEFDASDWLRDAREMRGVMDAVRCRAGATQIERTLQHIARLRLSQALTAAVFVGDCVEEEPDRIAQRAGELGLLGVPLFVFQEGSVPEAERVFREMARLSRGAYSRFDVASATQLRELLAAAAVYASGGRAALQAFARRSGKAVLALTSQLERI